MIQEFKDFIMKGNVLELAVAVIIAGAFGVVVSTFTNNIMMPPLGLLLGGVDFSDLKVILQPEVLNAAGEITTPEVAIGWGKLINDIITFLITAFAVFLVIKAYNKANPPAPAAPAGPTDIDLLTEIRDALRK